MKHPYAAENSLTEKNLQAEIFSVPVVADELERMWRIKRPEIARIAAEIADRKPANICFFGSGGSFSALYSGYYAMLRYTALPALYLISPEIVSAMPAALGPNSVAVGASYSGRTVDTMHAKRYLAEQQVPLLAITKSPDAELAASANWSLSYDSIALYSSPAYLTMLLAVELCRVRREWCAEIEAFEEALHDLPSLLRRIAESSRQLAAARGAELDSSENLIILAGGCCYTLGYMMAFDMFGEYLKQYCSFIHYVEFRHGPLEIVGPGEPTMMFLMGNDSSRPFARATLEFGRRNGAPAVVFDAAELAPKAHPMLDALVLYQSQIWLLYELACRRGIDLNAYRYMHVVPYAPGDSFY